MITKFKFAIPVFISLLLVSCTPATSKQESQIGVVEVATFAPYHNWISLGSPPNGATRIVSAKHTKIWVESSHGELFVVTLDFSCGTNQICWTWELTTSTPENNRAPWSLVRGMDCSSLNPNPYRQIVNPDGVMQECIYAPAPGIDMVADFFFALMSDGSIEFFDNTPPFVAQ